MLSKKAGVFSVLLFAIFLVNSSLAEGQKGIQLFKTFYYSKIGRTAPRIVVQLPRLSPFLFQIIEDRVYFQPSIQLVPPLEKEDLPFLSEEAYRKSALEFEVVEHRRQRDGETLLARGDNSYFKIAEKFFSNFFERDLSLLEDILSPEEYRRLFGLTLTSKLPTWLYLKSSPDRRFISFSIEPKKEDLREKAVEEVFSCLLNSTEASLRSCVYLSASGRVGLIYQASPEEVYVFRPYSYLRDLEKTQPFSTLRPLLYLRLKEKTEPFLRMLRRRLKKERPLPRIIVVQPEGAERPLRKEVPTTAVLFRPIFLEKEKLYFIQVQDRRKKKTSFSVLKRKSDDSCSQVEEISLFAEERFKKPFIIYRLPTFFVKDFSDIHYWPLYGVGSKGSSKKIFDELCRRKKVSPRRLNQK